MRRKRIKWAIVTAILLSGAALLYMVIVEPRTERTIRETQDTVYSAKAFMADLRYERRIRLIRQELDTLQEKEFTALFLSMYPVRTYDTYYLSYWRGLETFKAETVLENGRELAGTLAYLQELGNVPETVFFGLDPECLEEEYPLEDSLLQTIRNHPETGYEIWLVNPAMTYWRAKAEEEWQGIVDRYEKAARLLAQEENVKLYFAGDREWLVCNGDNYEEEKMPGGDVATTLLAYYTRDEYGLTLENLEQRMEDARELIANWRMDDRMLTGLEDKTLVFIGDSTFGNFSGSLAITGVVEFFTGADVLNCGWGGMAAADASPDIPDLPGLIRIIRQEDGGDGSGPPALQTAPALKRILGQGENASIFVLFGINDYIEGFPIRGEDPYAADTYEGALRTAIEELQAMFPAAELVLISPNYIYYNHCGADPVGEEGQVFSDYAQSMLGLAEEYRLAVIDFYGELGIDSENVTEYLQDEIHLNETGRFAAGLRVLEHLRQTYRAK